MPSKRAQSPVNVSMAVARRAPRCSSVTFLFLVLKPARAEPLLGARVPVRSAQRTRRSQSLSRPQPRRARPVLSPRATRHADTGGATESRRGSRSTDRRRAGVAQPAELAIWILRLYPTRLVQLFGDSLNSLTELLSRLCVCLILFSKFPLFP